MTSGLVEASSATLVGRPGRDTSVDNRSCSGTTGGGGSPRAQGPGKNLASPRQGGSLSSKQPGRPAASKKRERGAVSTSASAHTRKAAPCSRCNRLPVFKTLRCTSARGLVGGCFASSSGGRLVPSWTSDHLARTSRAPDTPKYAAVHPRPARTAQRIILRPVSVSGRVTRTTM